MDDRELGTVLAALRFWQRTGPQGRALEADIASDGGRFKPLCADEIDALCERLNLGDTEALTGGDDGVAWSAP